MTKDPKNPFKGQLDLLDTSQLVTASIAMHEMFMALKKGGFTSAQALTIIGVFLATNVGGEAEQPEGGALDG